MKEEVAQFFRFCVVGTIAFLVDTGAMEFAIRYLDLSAHTARFVSIPIAMQVAYLLNLTFTFRHKDGICFKTWWRFIAGNLAGAAINYGTFVFTLYEVLSESSRLDRMMAIVAGTGTGLVFNYWANRRFVFARKGHHES